MRFGIVQQFWNAVGDGDRLLNFFIFSFSAGYFRIIRQNERNHSEVFFYHSFQESNLKIVPKGSIEPIIPKQQKIKEKSGDAVVRS